MAQTNPMNASISFPGNIACGGSASLILKDDGTCTFNGKFHDSGLIPYDVAFALVVHTDSGKAFSFTKSGSVFGTVDLARDSTKSRDFSWNDATKNTSVAAAWPEIVKGFDFHWKADVGVNVANLLQDVEAVVAKIGTIAGQVIAVI
jgi:hypothetical protein